MADLGSRSNRSTWNGAAAASPDAARERWLAGVMAHEVNNHLAAALMELELAADGSHSPDINELLERLLVAVGSAGVVCRSTLGLLRPEAKETTNPGVAAEAVRRAVLCLGRLRSRLTVQITPGLEEVTTPLPLARMQQVVLNLVLNALRASEGPVSIWLASSEPILVDRSTRNRPDAPGAGSTSSSAISFAITDDGPGMPPDIAERLQGTTRPDAIDIVAAGGFGLSAVKHLVASGGGTIRVERPGDRGTRVVVTLPVAIAPPIRRAA